MYFEQPSKRLDAQRAANKLDPLKFECIKYNVESPVRLKLSFLLQKLHCTTNGWSRDRFSRVEWPAG
ncbi:hypothetical protein [Paenibacillus sp. LHD-38]|uniref:hypothetical protein n=1 Tax=Paenibacillus sp. LHD-38 TaxID=3072143 RepID=UPI00280DD3D6|nr:hypothetical protein [Paenibacillus sp. LHD-38]MDQ8736894.1 hypothetical protein [Paenibacillus sp. LHD-38]